MSDLLRGSLIQDGNCLGESWICFSQVMPVRFAAPTGADTPKATHSPPIETLDAVQRRVLWLATSIVHHANKVRRTPSGVKVGGHQASSASMVSIMTALYFAHLRGSDRVSVKPHAAPVLHAINYLLGLLDARYLTELRSFGGLQSYPSRTKDPDPVDFSTGSVGIGATATVWSAIAHRYVAGHFKVPQGVVRSRLSVTPSSTREPCGKRSWTGRRAAR